MQFLCLALVFFHLKQFYCPEEDRFPRGISDRVLLMMYMQCWRKFTSLSLRPDFTSKLVHILAFGTPKFYIAPYDKIKHELVNLSSNCNVKSGLSPLKLRYYYWLAPWCLFSKSALPIPLADIASKLLKLWFLDMTKKIAMKHKNVLTTIIKLSKVLRTFQNPTVLRSLETVCCRYKTKKEMN